MKKTKIIATIGPKSDSEEVIKRFVSEGVNIVRLNFSHGSYDYYLKVVDKIRKVEGDIGRKIPILQDLQGIKLRINEPESPIELIEGSTIKLCKGESLSSKDALYMDYPYLERDLSVGSTLVIGDGDIILSVVDRVNDTFILRVIEGGVISGRKGVNFKGTLLSVELPTDKDKKDIIFGVNELAVDFVCLSFVRNRRDITNLKRWAKQEGIKLPPIVAKIEKAEAVANIEDILDEVDGIMVARGDLGLELPIEEIPVLQKKLIELAALHKKFVIVATQMLESMTLHSKPTRAEVTDVANAIIDGTDALMLSNETAIGKYPVEAVRVMSAVIRVTEEKLADRILTYYKPGPTPAESVAFGAFEIANTVGAKAIAVFTRTGFTPLVISRLKPKFPVIAFTSNLHVYAKMHIYWNVEPVLVGVDKDFSDDSFLDYVEDVIRSRLGLVVGDLIVLVASSPLLGKRNIIRLYRIGEGS